MSRNKSTNKPSDTAKQIAEQLPEAPIVIPFRTKPSPGDVEQPKPVEPPEQSRVIQADATGVIRRDPTQEPKNVQFVPFPDGAIFKFQPNKARPGTFVINDGAGTPYAVALHAEIAELICKSVTIFFYQEQERARQKAAAAQEMTEGLPAEGSKVDIAENPQAAPAQAEPTNGDKS